MADTDLEQIRAARLAQLKSQSGTSSSPTTPDDSARESREAEARASVLAQILHPDAQDRLNRIKLVKAQRATDVENRLISLAQTGQLLGKVTEEQLKDLLGAMAEQEEKQGGGKSIKVVRRRADEDDDLNDLLAELEG